MCCQTWEYEIFPSALVSVARKSEISSFLRRLCSSSHTSRKSCITLSTSEGNRFDERRGKTWKLGTYHTPQLWNICDAFGFFYQMVENPWQLSCSESSFWSLLSTCTPLHLLQTKLSQFFRLTDWQKSIGLRSQLWVGAPTKFLSPDSQQIDCSIVDVEECSKQINKTLMTSVFIKY